MLVERVIENAAAANAHLVRGRVAVVIDVLRASSTIAAALAAGAEAVIPVATVDDARAVANGNGYLLGGERGGVAPDGFALGNSPREYTADRIAGRTIVLTTTNGTLALSRCTEADAVVLGAFTNLSAVVRWLRRRGQPVVLVCAGGAHGHAEEDSLCAGVFAHELGGKGPGVWEARALAADEPNVAAALEQGRHGQYLASIGFAADVAWCAARDRFDVVPVLSPDGRITAADY